MLSLGGRVMATGRWVCVLGAGPAGLYAANKLAKAGHQVVLLNRDIRPGGLAEYGIFHNKHRMKAGLRKMFHRILANENIHYRGNVTIGENEVLKLHDIEQLGFDSVLVAVGAQGIKWLNIDGSEAGHIYDAKQLVYHYNQLPPYARQAYPLGQRLTIIGAGNVAIDIAHWAVQQNVETVTLLVRRGPNQVKYTKKEIKLIGGHVDRAAFESEMERIAPGLRLIGEDVAETHGRMVDEFGAQRIDGSDTKIRFRFATSALAVDTAQGDVIEALRYCDNELYVEHDNIRCRSTERTAVLKTDSLVFCVGDAVDPEFGLPINRWGEYALAGDEDNARSYRVVDRDGWFAAGWARLASDGLVGKARKDGEVACEHIEVYLETQAPRDGRPLESLDDVLEARGHSAVDWAGYLAIRERENVVAQTRGLEDFRFESNEDMLALCK